MKSFVASFSLLKSGDMQEAFRNGTLSSSHSNHFKPRAGPAGPVVARQEREGALPGFASAEEKAERTPLALGWTRHHACLTARPVVPWIVVLAGAPYDGCSALACDTAGRWLRDKCSKHI